MRWEATRGTTSHTQIFLLLLWHVNPVSQSKLVSENECFALHCHITGTDKDITLHDKSIDNITDNIVVRQPQPLSREVT